MDSVNPSELPHAVKSSKLADLVVATTLAEKRIHELTDEPLAYTRWSAEADALVPDLQKLGLDGEYIAMSVGGSKITGLEMCHAYQVLTRAWEVMKKALARASMHIRFAALNDEKKTKRTTGSCNIG